MLESKNNTVKEKPISEVINSMSIEGIAEYIRDNILSHVAKDSYEILAQLNNLGWKFDRKQFDTILSKLRRTDGVISLSDVDSYIRAKPITLNGLIIKLNKRCNCYDCTFLQKLESNYNLHTLYSQSERANNDGIDRYCALNHSIYVKLNMDTVPDNCPINLALKDQQH